MFENWQNWQTFLLSLPAEGLLFVSAFVSATLFPGGSEALLVALVLADPEPSRCVLLTACASLGNTLGAMTSWGIGRAFPAKETDLRALKLYEKYGEYSLLLSWLPVIGDALPLIAGWRRISWKRSLVMIAIGKTARFCTIVALALYAKGFF